MDINSLLILIVLYKQSLDESLTVQSLLKIKNIANNSKLVIWDNSPEPQTEDAIIKINKILNYEVLYINTPENVPLSKVYNTVINKNPYYDFLLLFDQDSFFTEEYFQKLNKYSEENKDINLFLPLIKHNSFIISPGAFKYFKGKFWKKEKLGRLEAENILAIASGMAIRMSYLSKFGNFDERLNLYGIDTNFMIRYWKQNKWLYVFNPVFKHDLSDFNKESKYIKNLRFKDKIMAEQFNLGLFPKYIQMIGSLYIKYKIIKNRII